MTEQELVAKYRQLMDAKDSLEDQLKTTNESIEKTKQEIIDLFDSSGTERTATYSGVGYISKIKPKLYASCPEERKEDMFAAIRADGREDLIKPVVHHSSLATYVGELLESGRQVPECITYYLKPNIMLRRS